MNDLLSVNLLDIIPQLFSEDFSGPFAWLIARMRDIGWVIPAKISFFCALVVLGILGIIMLYRRLLRSQREARLRSHYLNISNKGNVASSYLLRASSLPKALSVEFYAAGYPLIAFQKQIKKPVAGQKADTQQKTAAQAHSPSQKTAPVSLIPNVNDPFKEMQQSQLMQNVDKAQVKLGAVSQLLGAATSFMPKSAQEGLKEKQAAVMGVQKKLVNMQDIPVTGGQKVGFINQNLQTLGIKEKTASGLDKLKSEAMNGMDAAAFASSVGQAVINNSTTSDVQIASSEQLEKAKTLQLAHSTSELSVPAGVTFAETPVLEPGQDIQVELRFALKEQKWHPVTYAYKIEMHQHPTLSLGMKAPQQIINGVVSFPLKRRWTLISAWFLTIITGCMTAGALIFIGSLLF